MFERIVMIIDDNPRVKMIHIPDYENDIEHLKQESDNYKDYDFIFIHKKTMKEAKDYLCDRNIVDVLVVDYNFNNDETFLNGTQFVEYVRKNVNKQCKIIFYTMQQIENIERKELLGLINSNVSKMYDKIDADKMMGKAIFEAATTCNPVVISLERFFVKYSELFKNYKYTILGNEFSLDEIINHIRIDDEIGRVFIDKLMYKSILKETNFEIQE